MSVSDAISSLVCQAGKCTFTRVDTDQPAIVPYDYWGNPSPAPTYLEYFEPTPPPTDMTTPSPTVGVNETIGMNQTMSPTMGMNETMSPTAGTNQTMSPTMDETLPPATNSTMAPTTNETMSNATNRRRLTPYPSPFDFTPYPTYSNTDTSIAPWFLPESQDMLSPTVALTRDSEGDLFNALVRDDQFLFGQNPSGTEWARLPEGMSIEETRCSLQFCTFYDCFANFGDYESMIGKPGVLHLIEEDLYYNIEFTDWTVDYATPGVGGGFQYIRDEVPIEGAPLTLDQCPKCNKAKASPSVLDGPIDYEFVEVSIEGVTSTADNTTVKVKGVAQDNPVSCNLRPKAEGGEGSGKVPGHGHVRPNAKNLGETVMLRRFRLPENMGRFEYTVYFSALNPVGSCDGEVRVCVPKD